MKAAVLTERKVELDVQEYPDPVLTPGSAIVKVLAAPVAHHFGAVFSGEVPFPILLPFIPGCSAIGEVEQVGSDAHNLKKGDLVYVDPTIRTRDDPHSPETILQGLFCPPGSLSEVFRNGGFAEKILLPIENALIIPPSLGRDAAKLTCINRLLVPYGGLLSGNFQPGDTLLLLGGTGYFGGCGIALALAMGARKVIIPGRSLEKLEPLVNKFGDRVVPVQLSQDDQENVVAFKSAAGGPIDLVLELLEANAPQSIIRSSLLSLRPFGTGVLMSGRTDNLEFPFFPIMTNSLTIKGCFMYPRTAGKQLIGLLEAGLIDPDLFNTDDQFSLDDVNEAVQNAKKTHGPFKTTVIVP
ncbi:alcohol dehydrogenase zinc-binding domain protein [Umbelopsis sp. PMI_123]|nr:alcohol dehydrogenase zinc-binding domain protein [Umbelopsis sp. PMI_123]